MNEGLQAITKFQLISGGYVGEETGSFGGFQNWTDVNYNGSVETTYYYRDSDVGQNNNSSRTDVLVRDTWTVERLSDNTLKITTNTIIVDIKVGNIVGVPPTWARSWFVRKHLTGAWSWRNLYNDVWTTRTAFSNISVGTKTIYLAPLQEETIQTVYYRNNTSGARFDIMPAPNIYTDEMWMGIRFKNNLPPDYRPGDRKVSSTWQSHNRGAGKCHRKVGTWNEMRTVNGGVGEGDPPNIKTSGVWKNQKKIGANA